MMEKRSDGTVVESDTEAMQAEKSPNTFVVLVVSLAILVVVAAALFWAFGLFTPMGGTGR